MDNLSSAFTVIVPARFNSTRFPGKPLVEINNKPMIQHVYERSLEANAKRVIVATDDKRIADAVEAFGGEVCMTREDHQSGTERLAEVVDKLALDAEEIIVNVQGDEPFIPAENISQVANNLANNQDCVMSTLATHLDSPEDIDNVNAVKVVAAKSGKALYFSRAPIPYDRDGRSNNDFNDTMQQMWRHIGIYAYRAGYLKTYIGYAPSPIEKLEKLEQLRALWYGDAIHVEPAVKSPPVGIDTPEDLNRLLVEN